MRLAGFVGVDNRRISEFELGREWPSAFDVERLAAALGVRPTTLVNGTDWGDRPRCSDLSRVFRGPKSYTPNLEREPADRFHRARLDFPELTKSLDAAILGSPHHESARFAETVLPVLSSREALLCLHLFAAGGWLERLSPQLCGFTQLPIVDSENETVVGAIKVPAIGIYLAQTPYIYFPNVAVRCKPTYFILDFLVARKLERGTAWIDLEVDGELHNSRRDKERARALRLQTRRVNVDHLQRDDFIEMLLDRLSS